jgi:hypothetical protein
VYVCGEKIGEIMNQLSLECFAKIDVCRSSSDLDKLPDSVLQVALGAELEPHQIHTLRCILQSVFTSGFEKGMRDICKMYAEMTNNLVDVAERLSK